MKHRYKGPRLHIKISRASFQEMAALLCVSRNHKHCRASHENGEIIRIDLPHLTLAPCDSIEQPRPVG